MIHTQESLENNTRQKDENLYCIKQAAQNLREAMFCFLVLGFRIHEEHTENQNWRTSYVRLIASQDYPLERVCLN